MPWCAGCSSHDLDLGSSSRFPRAKHSTGGSTRRDDASFRGFLKLLAPLGRKSIHQREAIEALLEPAREIIDPALTMHAAPLSDLLHGHAQNQNLVHQRRAVGAEFMLGAVQPQHGLALALGDRFSPLPAVDIFARGIDRLRAALGLLPIVLKRPAALILRLVDLAMRVQPRQRIVAD